MSTTDVRIKRLSEVHVDIGNAVLVALVLSKIGPHIFLAKDTNEYRGVITYTLRDAKQSIVNCKCWGSKEYIDEYHRQLKIGDVVDVVGAKVLLLTAISANDQHYQPLPTLHYALVLNEGQGYMERHDYNDDDLLLRMRQYLRLSHKPPCNVLNLADVRCSLSEMPVTSQHVDLLVVVAALRPVRTLKSTRNGQSLSCLETVVHDASCPDGMLLSIWHSDWIQRAEQYWTPRRTVLHLIDVRVSYSEYYKSTTLSCGAPTIIYENPIGVEAQNLLKFAETTSIKDVDMFAKAGADNLPQADQIQTQMTVRQIYARADGELKDTAEQFTAVLYAMVTKFDIDGQSYILNKKCKSCQRLIPQQNTECDNELCQLEFSLNNNDNKYEYFFNINIQFSDHTGTLVEGRLSNAVAERLLGLSVDEYMHLTATKKAQLKWRFLMEHFEAKLLIKKPGAVRRNLTVIVVDLRAVDINELAEKMVIF